jgi:hypothetical protein
VSYRSGLPQQAAVFWNLTGTVPTPGRIGDLWYDFVTATWMQATSISPVVFAPISGGGGPPAPHAPTHLPNTGTDPLTTASAVGLANANGIGVADSFARSDHLHKRDVRVAANGLDVGTRNRLNFVTGDVTIVLTDDVPGDEIDLQFLIAAQTITDAMLRNSAGVSVIGRAAGAAGVPADIVASADGDVLRRAGGVLGFGTIPESSVINLVGDLATLAAGIAASVPQTRLINTTSPILGGGNLSADLTLTFDQTVALDNNARVAVNLDGGATVGTRRRLNFIQAGGVTITIADDAGNEEIDISLSSTGGGSVQAAWNFDTSTVAADPGNKKFRVNNATLASVTAIYLNDTTVGGFDISTIAAFLANGNRIYIQQKNDATRAALFQVTGAATDNGGWWTVPVTTINDSGVLYQNNAECVAVLLLTAAAGAGSVNIVAATITAPYASNTYTATIVDASITPASQIMVTWGATLDTDTNGPDSDDLQFKAVAGTGQFDVTVCARDGGLFGGPIKINYLAG